MMAGTGGFGDYIVYVDESGDHGLRSINPVYPVFVLAFCVIRKEDYLNLIVPAIQALKFRYFDILQEKFRRSGEGAIEGWGVKVYP